MRQGSLRTHLRRWARGKKTLWTLNGLLLIICLSLLVDTYWDRLSSGSSSSLLESDDGSSIGYVMSGRNRAKPSQPLRQPRVPGTGTYSRRRATRSGSGSKGGVQKPVGPAYCTADQYANGTWEARARPPKTLAEIRKLNSLSVSIRSPLHLPSSRSIDPLLTRLDPTSCSCSMDRPPEQWAVTPSNGPSRPRVNPLMTNRPIWIGWSRLRLIVGSQRRGVGGESWRRACWSRGC